jgi:D-sedoheptulose 7-phosphate isomerase
MKPSVTVDQRIVSRLREGLSLQHALIENREFIEAVAEVSEEIVRALAGGRKIFFFGNGGSASDAQHLAAELVGRFKRERPALPAIALTANTSAVTAISNDYGYEMIFARQLEALGAEGDVAFGISTSGNSRNVVRGMEVARLKKLITVAMTGRTGGELIHSAEYCIQIPSDETPRIQEAHIMTGHILCEIVEQELFGEMGACRP